MAGLGVLVLTQGCATPTRTKTVSEALPRPGAKVVVGTVSNLTGQSFKVDVEAGLRAALVTQLQNRSLLAAPSPVPGDLRLELNVTEYRPGSAFQRWLLPGWGATVLKVQGRLLELDQSKAVAQIEHQRTVAVGGFYTLGAEHAIFKYVAGDLAHDLEVRIAKGGEFVVQAKSRADVVTVVEPRPDAPTVWISEVRDGRTESGRIGERHAAFGVSMGAVYFSREVPSYLRENLELELTAAGHRLASTNAAITLSCEVSQFWLHTKATALYWDVIAEMRLRVTRESPGAAPKEYVASARRRTYVWPSASLCAQVIDECTSGLMARLREDDSWH